MSVRMMRTRPKIEEGGKRMVDWPKIDVHLCLCLVCWEQEGGVGRKVCVQLLEMLKNNTAMYTSTLSPEITAHSALGL